ncbi:MAG: zinc ribbon domain-containing protein [Chloroflexi bacterium]|nr:zinc ribbon domain-containing protein [Chloroflexota bacterium]
MGTALSSALPKASAAPTGVPGQVAWRTFPEGLRGLPFHRLYHECGHRNGKLGLEDRRWLCPGCGMAHDRDVNAARNIRDYGP